MIKKIEISIELREYYNNILVERNERLCRDKIREYYLMKKKTRRNYE